MPDDVTVGSADRVPEVARAEPRRRAPRADARRNRAKVLTAARAAFAQDGPSVSLDEIARLAGVGPGTVHRHFPTKDELLTAVLADRSGGCPVAAWRSLWTACGGRPRPRPGGSPGWITRTFGAQ